jgi:hypothetical protein
MVVDPEVKASAERDWVNLVKLKKVVGAQEVVGVQKVGQ